MEDIKALINKLFELAQINIDSLEIIEEESGIFAVTLKTPDSGMVIGPHGKNIAMFGNIIKLMLSKHLDKRVRVHFDVNDYGSQKQDKFEKFIQSKIAYVKSSGNDVKMPFLTSYERKKVHNFISENSDESIFTKSDGEWGERRLFICKKAEALTIDIDWDDI